MMKKWHVAGSVQIFHCKQLPVVVENHTVQMRTVRLNPNIKVAGCKTETVS